MLQAALSYRTAGSCPAASSIASKQGFAPTLISTDSPAVLDTRATAMSEQNKILSTH